MLRFDGAKMRSTKSGPGRWSRLFGMAGVSLVAIVYLRVRYVVFGFGVAGWASTMVSVWLVGGMILGTLGVIGLYLGKVFEQVKGRPLYVVAEVTPRAQSGHSKAARTLSGVSAIDMATQYEPIR